MVNLLVKRLVDEICVGRLVMVVVVVVMAVSVAVSVPMGMCFAVAMTHCMLIVLRAMG